MKKNIKKILKNKWVKWGIAPTLLLLLWLVVTLMHIINYDSSFTTLSYSDGKNVFTKLTHEKLYARDKIRGEFEAKENNLGVVALRVRTYQRVSYEDEDILVFRIREKGNKSWYTEHKYKSGLFFEVPFYPFGFAKILESKGKTYVFELESTRGNDHNGIAISKREPVMASKYEESKTRLLAEKSELIKFTSKKFINAFQVFDIAFYSFVYLLPFLFYTLSLSLFKRVFLPFLLSLIFLHIFIINIQDDFVYLFIIGLWIATVLKYKHKVESLIIAFFLLALCPFILIYKIDYMAERAASWAFFFLILSVMRAFMEIRKKQEKIKTSS